ncbi:hypothetical protein OOK27_05385 [Streptomyces canus]|uniref:hypothetical protein n=1 Tax=Streptomyces canus TaxID=58343 RepID=UPI0022581635|nr:hypothetical protein [Streptomyces canus]MCX5253606.1 hypothetical protein [Streptomyces canus]
MPAKRQPARRTARSSTRRATPARRRPATRKHPARRVKIPRRGPLHARLGAWLALRVIAPMVADRQSVMQSRKDAAILRATHKDCPTCHGNGTIYTKSKKTGAWTGSKPCPAKPTKEKVSRWEINKAARVGAEKRSGLVGWTCPCGKKEKPRYRDAKAATTALRAHEKQKHGGTSVGGTWYAQQTEAAALAPSKPGPATKARAKAATA